jgi:hypothetical protein
MVTTATALDETDEEDYNIDVNTPEEIGKRCLINSACCLLTLRKKNVENGLAKTITPN